MSRSGRADDARTSCGGQLSLPCQGEHVYCKGVLSLPLAIAVKDEHENRKFPVTCGQ